MNGVFKGNGVADLAIFAAWVFIPGRYACPDWELVPSIARAWGHMLAGYFIHVLGECHTGYSCLQRKRNKQHEEKGECAHAYIYERIYMLIFSLEFPASGLGFPQHPAGSPSQRPTKRVGILAWHVFVEARAWTWVSTTHTDLSDRDTPKPGVPRVRLMACVCAHGLILITGVYGCLLHGLSPAPRSSKTWVDLPLGFVTVHTVASLHTEV